MTDDAMHVTWTALRIDDPAAACPWRPEGARFTQAGPSGAGRAVVPAFDGRWWSVLGVWDSEAEARAAAPEPGAVAGAAWHVVLEPASYHGDARLSGGAQPFAGLPRTGKTAGASVVITLAGLGSDERRAGEFFERFVALGEDVERAPGHRAALVQAPSDGAVLTFSAWERLRDAVTWAYHRPEHTATVRRQQDHRLLESTGFLRCAVKGSSGTLGDRADPLAGLTGTTIAKQEGSSMNETDGIGAYGAAWLEEDEGTRRELVERAWAPGAVYCDPLAFVEGGEALVAHIGAFQASMPGGRVEVTAEAVRHHDSAHFPWAIRDAAGATVLTGFDVVQLDADGRITRLTGFFDA